MIREANCVVKHKYWLIIIAFQFVAENPTSKGHMSLSAIAVEAFPLTYILQTEGVFDRKLSMTDRLSYKPGKGTSTAVDST